MKVEEDRECTEGIASTPSPPYYAVIFTSLHSEDTRGYDEAAAHMEELAKLQPGFLGIESVRDGLGVTVSYWKDLESIKAWRAADQHVEARRQGRSTWYNAFRVRICRVEREYGT